MSEQYGMTENGSEYYERSIRPSGRLI